VIPRSLHGLCIAAFVAGLTLAMPGCSASGEGDRCTFFPSPPNSACPNSINGTDECQSGLVCYAAFNTAEFPYDRCCPPGLVGATVPACQMAGTIDGGNPTSGRDAAPDTSTDTSTDALTDAPADGPSDAMEEGGDAPSDAKPSGDK
jgi:hypothetical protein